MALIQIHDGSTDFHAKELLSSSKYLCKYVQPSMHGSWALLVGGIVYTACG
jgi:hypothetical protein